MPLELRLNYTSFSVRLSLFFPLSVSVFLSLSLSVSLLCRFLPSVPLAVRYWVNACRKDEVKLWVRGCVQASFHFNVLTAS